MPHHVANASHVAVADLEAFAAIARSLPDQTFVRCTLVELHSAKVWARPANCVCRSCTLCSVHFCTSSLKNCEMQSHAFSSKTLNLSAAIERHLAPSYLQVKVVSVKTDLRYWPCWQLALDAGTGEWRRQVLSTVDSNPPAAGSATAATGA